MSSTRAGTSRLMFTTTRAWPPARALLGLVLLLFVACSHRETGSSRPAASAAPLPPAEPTAHGARKVVGRSIAHAAPPPAHAPAARGSIALVVQRVDAVCSIGGHSHHFYVGTDLLIERHDEGEPAHQHASRDFVFCPEHTADGGVTKPKLNTWRMCRAYSSCRIIPGDAGGATDRAEVRCGKEHVILEVEGERTVLRGPFGERVLAPYPMRIAPTRRQTRRAAVDC